jgi:3-hydroxyanthranilate 3,4-dioxygenase
MNPIFTADHYSRPINLQAWLVENASKLVPPVNNQQIWKNSDLICTVVGGPNQRTDFHDDPFEEYFHQFKGNASIIIADRGKFERIHLNEGDVFLLPPHVRHSPQRHEEGSLCTVIERNRSDAEIDAFEWYCANCATLVTRVELQLALLRICLKHSIAFMSLRMSSAHVPIAQAFTLGETGKSGIRIVTPLSISKKEGHWSQQWPSRFALGKFDQGFSIKKMGPLLDFIMSGWKSIGCVPDQCVGNGENQDRHTQK